MSPILKSNEAKRKPFARRLYFDSYYSFVITDFWKAFITDIIQGNALVCKKVFPYDLWQWQKYRTDMRQVQTKGQSHYLPKIRSKNQPQGTSQTETPLSAFTKTVVPPSVERQRVKFDNALATAALCLAKEYMQPAKNES